MRHFSFFKVSCTAFESIIRRFTFPAITTKSLVASIYRFAHLETIHWVEDKSNWTYRLFVFSNPLTKYQLDVCIYI